MAVAPHPQMRPDYSVEEYFALEERSERRHEYYRGEIFAMTGGSLNHNRISSDLVALLSSQLRGGPCEVLNSDMRLLVQRHRLYTYPDAMVICGEPELVSGRTDTVLNPTVLFEVLSPSTQAYDRGEKFGFYRSLPSFQEYVLIDQEKVQVELHQRQAIGWLFTEFDSLDQTVVLTSIPAELPLRRLYERVDWLP